MERLTAPDSLQLIATALFAVALVHTFAAGAFERLAHRQTRHAGLWHLLGEVEVAFGLWAAVLVCTWAALRGAPDALAYLESRDFTEPMFVFVIMVIAATRPVLQLASRAVTVVSSRMPLAPGRAHYFTVLTLIPLLGSFITEPAAMTLAALMLRGTVFTEGTPLHLKYATLGVLFVNVSIGGTLTHFAAPPVLMVASTWNWDMPFMLATFGWKAALAVLVNAGGATFVFRNALADASEPTTHMSGDRVPPSQVLLQVALLCAVVLLAHHPAAFIGVFLLFLGHARAYPQFHDRLIVRESLLVAFFLAGLVVLGGQQNWWLEPVLTSLDERTVYFGAAALTAITDNAALTYLGSLVPDLSEPYRVALVGGAVAGGGLTVVANAPNLVGVSMLRGSFPDQSVSPLGLLAAAAAPTAVALAALSLP